MYTVASLKEDFFLCEKFLVSKERCSKITKFEVDNNSNSFFCLLYFCWCSYSCVGIREDLGVCNRMIIIFVEESVWHYLLQNISKICFCVYRSQDLHTTAQGTRTLLNG